MIHFAMVNVGPKYPMAYVETLVDMIRRNASRLEHDAAFWCITDRPEELPEGVNPIAPYPGLPGWWNKCWLFSPLMPWGAGERVVYFDLDVAITGRLEDLVETTGIIRDPLWPCYNSSVMIWNHGDHSDIWSAFDPAIIDQPDDVVPPECLPAGQINGGDQAWITKCDRYASGAPWRLLPGHWCLSYREHAQAWPPDGCKVVYFNGQPKPAEITDGWVPEVWKVGGFTSLPVMDGANVTFEALYDNIRANVVRDLPWFAGGPPSNRTVVLICGGPSMKKRLGQIRDHRRRGATLVSVNNALGFLVANGLKPDIHVMLDARAENVDFLKDAPLGVRYYLASQCHPSLFEALEGRDVTVWHNGFGDCEGIREILQPWWDGPDARPIRLVPGGGTVGLRALFLSAYSGCKRIHVYGMDSSYQGDEHHAYPQALNDDDEVQTVALYDEATGETKRYVAARWMVRQAEEMKWSYRDLRGLGVDLFFHGEGLVPDIAKQLRAQELAS